MLYTHERIKSGVTIPYTQFIYNPVFRIPEHPAVGAICTSGKAKPIFGSCPPDFGRMDMML